MSKWFAILLCLMTTYLSGIDPSSLSFSCLTQEGEKWLKQGAFTSDSSMLIGSLSSYHQKNVEICGFLVQEENGWVLASQPSLRSCCIGSKHKASLIVTLDRGFPAEVLGKAQTLQGKFCVDVKRDREGHIIQLYRMDNALLAAKDLSHFPIFSVSSLFIIALGAIGIISYKKKRKALRKTRF